MNNRLKHHWLRIKNEAVPRWQHLPTFYEEVSALPYNNSIQRPNPNKPYGPDNFIFMAPHQWNGKPAKTLRYKNRTLTINEWAQQTNLSSDLIRNRLRRGWTIARILETGVTK